MPKTASHDKDGMSRRICRAIDLDHEAYLAFAELEKLKRSFSTPLKLSIIPMNATCFTNATSSSRWRKVADEIGYSESHTKRLHAIAVKKMILHDTP